MQEEKQFEFIDFLVILVKWKKFLFFLAVITAALVYTIIYFNIAERYDAEALIVPSESNQMSGFSSLLKNIGNIPLQLGQTNNSQGELYASILNSRTTIEQVIDTFNLLEDYFPESREKTIKAFREDMVVDLSKDATVGISVRSQYPQKAADIANYLVDKLNSSVIELNVQKSKENRQFIEERYNEIKTNLKIAEDSMMYYQMRSGVIEAQEQIRATIQMYAQLDAQLAAKEVELSSTEKMLGPEAPVTQNLRIAVIELRKKAASMKNGSEGNSFFLPMQTIPQKAVNYFRYYRDVEVNQALLEFIIPLYEQARFEEQKETPILHVIDYAVAPEKKSYPPRTLFTLAITLGVLLISFTFIIIAENPRWKDTEKMLFIKNNLFRWKVRA